ncbi:MAG: energy transducer TonB [Cytophagales bacterium]|nr:MAG: energy transducer TonB [Cytophagales bacterium]
MKINIFYCLILILGITFFFTQKSYAQTDVYTTAEKMPEQTNGLAGYYQFIYANLRYPEAARTQSIEGRVFVQFIIEKDGSLSNFAIVKGLGHGCDEEAIRVLKLAPRWKPAYQGGQAVRMRYTLPITFKPS